jgi:pimeloyl-ACP methyl ester carboxylesterase
MSLASPEGRLAIDGAALEYRHWGPLPGRAPTLLLLHEGLGCVRMWGDFPERLASATGHGVFAWSRAGYGESTPAALPRRIDYMHREALEVLPKLLDAIGFERGILVGHSDGASIATLYVGGMQDHRVRGLALIAPHFVVEDVTVAAIREAKTAYETGDLKARLAKRHVDVENAFRGWNDIWLDPEFRDWDISESLAYVRVPIELIQGTADPYGTRRQIAIAEEECYCPVDATLLDGIGHAPHREAPDATLAAVAGFATRILDLHEKAAA